MLGQAPIRGDLASIHCQEWSHSGLFIEMQMIIAADILRMARAIVAKCAYPGKRPNNTLRLDTLTKVLIGRRAEISDLVGIGVNIARIAGKAAVRCAKKSEILLERQRNHHPMSAQLKDVGVVMIEEPRHHDVAALVEPQRKRQRTTEHLS